MKRAFEKVKVSVSQIKKVSPLYGLVLTGGHSTRMQMDKSILDYHGQKQSEYCFDLLLRYCDKVFISNRKDQSHLAGHKGFPQIHDLETFGDIGPLGGLLSAMHKYPDADWLVLACDLPFVNERTIERLIQKRNRRKMATAYISTNDGLPEPLCAIYQAKSQPRLLRLFKKGIHCPRKLLINSNVELLRQRDRSELENINSPDEVKAAVKKLHKHH